MSNRSPTRLAAPADLDETAQLVTEAGWAYQDGEGRRCARSSDELQAGIGSGTAGFGDIDVVVANAGVVLIFIIRY